MSFSSLNLWEQLPSRNRAEKCVLLIILTNHCAHLFQQGFYWWAARGKKRKKARLMYNVHSVDFLSLLHTREHLCWWLVTLPRGITATPTWEYWVQGQQRPTAAEPGDWQNCNKLTQPCYIYTMVSLIRSNVITYINYDKYIFWHLQQLGFTTAALCFDTNTMWKESSHIHSIRPDRNNYHRKTV